MMKKFYLIVLVLLTQISCSINQYREISDSHRQRHGKWIEKDSVENAEYVMKGKYKMGEKTGVWKTYLNGKLYQKDKIKDSITITKVYFPNGNIMEKGQSKLIVKDHLRHWFYYGNWEYYDKNGKLEYIKKYQDNNKVDSISGSRAK